MTFTRSASLVTGVQEQQLTTQGKIDTHAPSDHDVSVKCAESPRIDVASLPDISMSEMNFYDTSFFRHNRDRQLPTPEWILRQYPKLTSGIVKLKELALAIKVGYFNEVNLEEAQTLRAIKLAFAHNEIPVPELYGWRQFGNRNFIYMTLVEGPTLLEAWDSLLEAEKESICAELMEIIRSLRRITRDSFKPLICSVNGGPVQDRFGRLENGGGPFASIRVYNNWLYATATMTVPQVEGVVEAPYRDCFPDSGNIFFTHGDLHLSNIIISGPLGSRKVSAIIDWEQSGWYPEYWEYCKLYGAMDYGHEWRKRRWVDKLMPAFEEEWDGYSEYVMWRIP